MTKLEQEIKEFADARFGKREISSRIRKLGEEFGELAEAVVKNDHNNIKLEAADMCIILSDILATLDGSSLQEMVAIKLHEIKNRPPTKKEMKGII